MTITEDWCNQKIAEWAPASTRPMDFCAVLLRASYDNPRQGYNTPDVIKAELDMLLSTGIGSVRVDINYDWWLQSSIAASKGLLLLNKLASTITNLGKRFVIADAGAESYRNKNLSWSSFKTEWVKRVRTLAALYKPSHYIVIKEPAWYFPMISVWNRYTSARNVSDWVQLCRELVAAVKSASPTTKCGIAANNGSPFDMKVIQACLGITNLDFIGFDMYGSESYYSTMQFLNRYGTGGKDVWTAECWSIDGPSVFDPSRADLDALWIRAHYYFCQTQILAVEMSPFYSDCFSMYSQPADPQTLISLYNTTRQPVYGAYKSITTGSVP
mgnify:FL=1